MVSVAYHALACSIIVSVHSPWLKSLQNMQIDQKRAITVRTAPPPPSLSSLWTGVMYVNQSILRALDRRCHLINRINQSQCMNLVVYASSERGVRNVFLPHLAALPKSRQPPSVTVCMRRRFHFHTFWTNRQDLWRNMEVDPLPDLDQFFVVVFSVISLSVITPQSLSSD